MHNTTTIQTIPIPNSESPIVPRLQYIATSLDNFNFINDASKYTQSFHLDFKR